MRNGNKAEKRLKACFALKVVKFKKIEVLYFWLYFSRTRKPISAPTSGNRSSGKSLHWQSSEMLTLFKTNYLNLPAIFADVIDLFCCELLGSVGCDILKFQ